MNLLPVQGWLSAAWCALAGQAVEQPGVRAEADGIWTAMVHSRAIAALKLLQQNVQDIRAAVAVQQAFFMHGDSPWPILIAMDDRAGMVHLLGLVQHGLTLSAEDASSLLINACDKGYINVVNAMLGDGVHDTVRRTTQQVINREDTRHHRTAIRWASKDGHKEIIRRLIANGARATLAQRLFVHTEWLTVEQLKKYTVIEHRWRDNVHNFYQAGGVKWLLVGSITANVLFGPAATGFLLTGGFRMVAFAVQCIFTSVYYLAFGGLTTLATVASHLTSVATLVCELGIQALLILAVCKMNPLQHIARPIRYLGKYVPAEVVRTAALGAIWFISSTIGFGGLFAGAANVASVAVGTTAGIATAGWGIGLVWSVRLLPATVVAVRTYWNTPAAHQVLMRGANQF